MTGGVSAQIIIYVHAIQGPHFIGIENFGHTPFLIHLHALFDIFGDFGRNRSVLRKILLVLQGISFTLDMDFFLLIINRNVYMEV